MAGKRLIPIADQITVMPRDFDNEAYVPQGPYMHARAAAFSKAAEAAERDTDTVEGRRKAQLAHAVAAGAHKALGNREAEERHRGRAYQHQYEQENEALGVYEPDYDDDDFVPRTQRVRTAFQPHELEQAERDADKHHVGALSSAAAGKGMRPLNQSYQHGDEVSEEAHAKGTKEAHTAAAKLHSDYAKAHKAEYDRTGNRAHADEHDAHKQMAAVHRAEAKSAPTEKKGAKMKAFAEAPTAPRASGPSGKKKEATPRALQKGKKGGTFYVSEGGRKVYSKG